MKTKTISQARYDSLIEIERAMQADMVQIEAERSRYTRQTKFVLRVQEELGIREIWGGRLQIDFDKFIKALDTENMARLLECLPTPSLPSDYGPSDWPPIKINERQPKPKPKPKGMNDEQRAKVEARRAEVLRLRESGMTLAEIGKALGVTGSRVSQIIAKANRIANYRPKPEPVPEALDFRNWIAHQELSVRSTNVLINISNGNAYYGVPRLDFQPNIESVASLITFQRLAEAPNCGRISINEIAEWLDRAGLKLQGMPQGHVTSAQLRGALSPVRASARSRDTPAGAGNSGLHSG